MRDPVLYRSMVRMRSHRLPRFDDIESAADLSTGLMQVDCQDFLSTSLTHIVLTTCSKSANINCSLDVYKYEVGSSLIFTEMMQLDEVNRLDVTTELYYIWRKHANLSSVKQLKPKTWRIFDEFDVILHHIYGNG